MADLAVEFVEERQPPWNPSATGLEERNPCPSESTIFDILKTPMFLFAQVVAPV